MLVNGGRVWHVPVCFHTPSSPFLAGLHFFSGRYFCTSAESHHHGPNEVEGGESRISGVKVTGLEIDAKKDIQMLMSHN